MRNLIFFEMSVCNFKAYLSWLKQTYSEPLDGAILDTLANVDRSNKELWKAMNFDEIHKVRYFFRFLLPIWLFSLS